ncbi:MAG: hypothetical protein GF355_08150 [Candidatus Eisenbacteria bacterium]|nr:hypothetical protein [Candidatus Eisenbacteria bacterium]
MICCVLSLVLARLLIPSLSAALEPPPPPVVTDRPNDAGNGLLVTWRPPLDAPAGLQVLVERRSEGAPVDTIGPLAAFDPLRPGEKVTHADESDVGSDRDYSYRMAWVAAGDTVWSSWSPPMRARLQWYNTERTAVAVGTVVFAALLVGFVITARRGRELFIRKIPGLEAVEEAVGRATEMGRPILYSPGLDPMDEVATVASINILGQVARKAAQYETRLMVPNRDPIVMAVAQEVVRDAHSEVGRPDTYHTDNIYYTTYSQFGYAAAVCGTMMRDRPATNFFIGRFYAESLILAETGNATGAIQIAGTDADAQLPFFITSCDYTLIGEELYAGSVYLSREPLLLGALKGQDAAKAIVIIIIIVGTILALMGIDAAPLLD